MPFIFRWDQGMIIQRNTKKNMIFLVLVIRNKHKTLSCSMLQRWSIVSLIIHVIYVWGS